MKVKATGAETSPPETVVIVPAPHSRLVEEQLPKLRLAAPEFLANKQMDRWGMTKTWHACQFDQYPKN